MSRLYGTGPMPAMSGRCPTARILRALVVVAGATCLLGGNCTANVNGTVSGTVLPGTTGPVKNSQPTSDVVVHITPMGAHIERLAKLRYSAQVTFAASDTRKDTGVVWKVLEGPDGGAMDETGQYTAPATLGKYHIVATSVADPRAFATTAVYVGPSLVLAPSAISMLPGTAQHFNAYVTGLDNTQVTWSLDEKAGPDTAVVSSSGVLTVFGLGTYHVRATSVAEPDLSGVATVNVTLNAVPVVNAPSNDTSAPADGTNSTSFLYSGDNPTQTGVDPDAIQSDTAAVVRGTVLDQSGAPIPGVLVNVVGHPEYGSTRTRSDGQFDMAVNGEETLTIELSADGYVSAERTVAVGTSDWDSLQAVTLMPLDSSATVIDFSGNADAFQAAAETYRDEAGAPRRSYLLFPPHVRATATFLDGSSQPLPVGTVRITGLTGEAFPPSAMPADLPVGTAYTYAVDYSVDEAADAESITLSAPAIAYLDNFLKLPVGTPVPSGELDLANGSWQPQPDGEVIGIVGVDSQGRAEIDLDGDGKPDSVDALAAKGITVAERKAILTVISPPDQSSSSSSSSSSGSGSNDSSGSNSGSSGSGSSGSGSSGSGSSGSGSGAGSSGGGSETTLMRVPVNPLSGYDYNYDGVPPDVGAGSSSTDDSNRPPPPSTQDTKKACQGQGSIIEFENQVLGEDVDLPGTGMFLSYRSNRTPGFIPRLEVPLTSGTVPSDVKSIGLTVGFAGSSIQKSLSSPRANMAATVELPTTDPYGRPLHGSQVATTTIDFSQQDNYVFPAADPSGGSSFGLPGVVVGSTPEIQGQDSSIVERLVVPYLDDRDYGFGGWHLSAQHILDRKAGILWNGDGTHRNLLDAGRTIKTIAGQVDGYNPPGLAWQNGTTVVVSPEGVAWGPNGYYFISDGASNTILVGRPDHELSIFAGSGDSGSSGDGGPALAAGFGEPTALAFSSQNNELYVADGQRIRMIDVVVDSQSGAVSSGDIHAFAGTGNSDDPTQLPKGSPAAKTNINPDSLSVGPDGTVYVASQWKVLSIKNGAVTTLAKLDGPISSIAALSNGDIYAVAESSESSSGRTFSLYQISGGNATLAGINLAGYSTTQFDPAPSLAPAPDGSVFLGDPQHLCIMKVSAGSDPETVAGDCNATATTGGGELASFDDAATSTPVETYGLASDASGNVLVERVSDVDLLAPTAESTLVQEGIVPSEDGKLVYEFDLQGRQTDTLDAVTGVDLLRFAYDTNGLLTTVTDQDGRTVQIQRPSKSEIDIVGWYGQETKLAINSDGYVTSITKPGATASVTADYYTSPQTGLLSSFTDENGHATKFLYDKDGRLKTHTDAVSSVEHLTPSTGPTTHSVIFQSGMGRRTVYSVQQSGDSVIRSVLFPDSTTNTTTTVGDTQATTTLADGTTLSETDTPDPRFDLLAPFAHTTVMTLPSKESLEVDKTVTATLSDPTKPLSLTDLKTTSSLGGLVTTTQYAAGTGSTPSTVTVTTPMQRAATMKLDATAGRPTELDLPELAPITYAYYDSTAGDLAGRLKSVTQGARTTSFTYYDTAGSADAGLLASITDAMNETLQFSYFPDQRLQTMTLPDGDTVQFTYDAVGNMTSLVTPGDALTCPAETHGFNYTPVDLMSEYDAPKVNGAPNAMTQSYDLDKLPQVQSLPDSNGTASITTNFDKITGNLDTMVTSRGTYTYGYDPKSGKLTSITAPGDGNGDIVTSYATDGPLLKSVTWTQNASPKPTTWGSISYGFDDYLRLYSIQVNADPNSEVDYGYDDDGLLLETDGPGSNYNMWVTRDPASGFVTNTEFGNATTRVDDVRSYNQYGELSEYHAGVLDDAHQDLIDTKYESTDASDTFARDALGRVTKLEETVLGTSSPTLTYSYDHRGRLTEVDNLTANTKVKYTYDANGNRLTKTDTSGSGTTWTGTYDAQDRLITYGTDSSSLTTYAYTDWGALKTKTAANGDATTYTYDELGNLTKVVLPTAKDETIDYVVDGENHRIERTVSTTSTKAVTGTTRYLWDGPRLIAETDGSGKVLQRYAYGLDSNVPDYMVVTGGDAYRLIKDERGSVRLVVDVDKTLTAASDAVVERIDYDEYGIPTFSCPNLTGDACSGFQPFEFAGGIYDPDTGLVRFGARDYDPETGRWTEKDPLLFGGGDTDLYVYVGDDPVDFVDPTGGTSVVDATNSYKSSSLSGRETAKLSLETAGAVGGTAVVLFGGELLDAAGAALLSLGEESPLLGQFLAGISGGGGAGFLASLLSKLRNLNPCPPEDDAPPLSLSQTVLNHAAERPYVNSILLPQEIMASGPGSADPGGIPGGFRWDVAGAWNASSGTWQLVVGANGVIYHFLFTSKGQ